MTTLKSMCTLRNLRDAGAFVIDTETCTQYDSADALERGQ